MYLHLFKNSQHTHIHISFLLHLSVSYGQTYLTISLSHLSLSLSFCFYISHPSHSISICASIFVLNYLTPTQTAHTSTKYCLYNDDAHRNTYDLSFPLTHPYINLQNIWRGTDAEFTLLIMSFCI